MTNNPNPSLMGEERARRAVFRAYLPLHPYFTDCETDMLLERGVDPDRALQPQELLSILQAFAEEARAAERERCAAIAEIAPDGSDGNMHGPMEAYRHARREIATAIRKLLV